MVILFFLPYPKRQWLKVYDPIFLWSIFRMILCQFMLL